MRILAASISQDPLVLIKVIKNIEKVDYFIFLRTPMALKGGWHIGVENYLELMGVDKKNIIYFEPEESLMLYETVKKLRIFFNDKFSNILNSDIEIFFDITTGKNSFKMAMYDFLKELSIKRGWIFNIVFNNSDRGKIEITKFNFNSNIEPEEIDKDITMNYRDIFKERFNVFGFEILQNINDKLGLKTLYSDGGTIPKVANSFYKDVIENSYLRRVFFDYS
ncbi:hypothetical protein JXR93_11745, partial [bacterium]|nr:hypothetical protein [bacterium]